MIDSTGSHPTPRRGYSAEQIRAAEAPHLAAGEPLMRWAAAGLAAEIGALVASETGSPRILLLVGSGNNGGDALFAGAELAADGAEVRIVATGSRMHPAGLAAALDAGAIVVDAEGPGGRLADIARWADVVVDAILGTGTSANPALRGSARDVVAAIVPIVESADGPAVVAVDIPSGIDPDDGSVPDPLVLPADLTVTFGGMKAGLLRLPASAFAGDVVLVDIGLGPDLEGMVPVVIVETTEESEG